MINSLSDICVYHYKQRNWEWYNKYSTLLKRDIKPTRPTKIATLCKAVCKHWSLFI